MQSQLDLKLDSKESADENVIYSQLMQLIESQNALIKVIESKVDFNRDWEFMLKSLADPKNVRPLKSIDEKWDRECVLNPKTWQYERRQVGVRGRSKDTIYIKKTSTSLLPPHGKMVFFNLIKYPVGMLFDIDHCKISEKYIFPANAGTNSYWWLGADNPNAGYAVKAISLSGLRARLAEPETCMWNEILARPSKKSLVALFAPKYTYTDRINAIHKKFLVKEMLGVDLPLLIITPSNGVTFYSFDDQIKDIIHALNNPEMQVANQFIQRIFALPSFLSADNYVAPLRQWIPTDLVQLVRGVCLQVIQLRILSYVKSKNWNAILQLLISYAESFNLKKVEEFFEILLNHFSEDEIFASEVGKHLLKHSALPLLLKISREMDLLRREDQIKAGIKFCSAPMQERILVELAKHKDVRLQKWLLNTVKEVSFTGIGDAVSLNNILHLAISADQLDEELVECIFKHPSVLNLLKMENKAKNIPIQLAVEKNRQKFLGTMILKYPLYIDVKTASIFLSDLLKNQQFALVRQSLRCRLTIDPKIVNGDEKAPSAIYSSASEFLLTLELIQAGFNTLKLNEVGAFIDKILVLPKLECLAILKALRLERSPELQKAILFRLFQANKTIAMTYIEDTPIDISATDEKGRQLIYLASLDEKLDQKCLSTLIQKGASLEDFSGFSPIGQFIKTNNHYILEYLISSHIDKLSAVSKKLIFNYFVHKRKASSINLFYSMDPEFPKKIILAGDALNCALKAQPYDSDKLGEINWLLSIGYSFLNKNPQTPVEILLQQKNYAGIDFILSRVNTELSRADLLLLCYEFSKSNDNNRLKMVLGRVNFKFLDNSLVYAVHKQAIPDLDLIVKLSRKCENLLVLDANQQSIFDFSFSLQNQQIFGVYLKIYGQNLSEKKLAEFILAGSNANKFDNLILLLTLYKNKRSVGAVEVSDSNDLLLKVTPEFINNIFKTKLSSTTVNKLCEDTLTLEYFIENFVELINLTVLEAVLLKNITQPQNKWLGKILQARPQVNVNQQDEKQGDSALHYALRESKPELSVIKVFCKAGADFNLRNKAGVTPLSIMQSSSYLMKELFLDLSSAIQEQLVLEAVKQKDKALALSLIKLQSNFSRSFVFLLDDRFTELNWLEMQALSSGKKHSITPLDLKTIFGGSKQECVRAYTKVNKFCDNDTRTALISILMQNMNFDLMLILLADHLSTIDKSDLKWILNFSIENNYFVITEFFLKNTELLRLGSDESLIKLWRQTLYQPKVMPAVYFGNLLAAGVPYETGFNSALQKNHPEALIAFLLYGRAKLTTNKLVQALPVAINYNLKSMSYISILSDEKLSNKEKVSFAKEILLKAIGLAESVRQAFNIVGEFEGLSNSLLFFSAKEFSSLLSPTWRNQDVAKDWLEVIEFLKQRIIKLAAVERPVLNQVIVELFKRKTSLTSSLFGGADLVREYTASCCPATAVNASHAACASVVQAKKSA